VPPPPSAGPPPAAPPTPKTTRLRVAGVSSVPAAPVAGRLFALRVRVLADGGEQVRAGAIRCSARVGATALRVAAKGWKRGLAYCAWRIPSSARTRRLRATVLVQSGELRVSRTLAKRVG
jgi:hypothetical protein